MYLGLRITQICIRSFYSVARDSKIHNLYDTSQMYVWKRGKKLGL
jgi:hypothetical protein